MLGIVVGTGDMAGTQILDLMSSHSREVDNKQAKEVKHSLLGDC